MTDAETRQEALDHYFQGRPDWFRFSYQHQFLAGWDGKMNGSGWREGPTLAGTSERHAHEAGYLAAANHLFKTGRGE
jgi:hypothetical protein